jgi:thiamine-phosphate pyrophosphorylase
MKQKNTIAEGLYLVLNPAMEEKLLLEKVQAALRGGVSMLQIWNNWPEGFGQAEKKALIQALGEIAAAHQVPLLINEEWELLADTALDGLHLDAIPPDFDHIKASLQRTFICGITCSNKLEVVQWAEQQQLDYISFCAMFPSASAGSCELVHPDSVRKARQMTRLPFFLSGGISPDHLPLLQELEFEGVAVISGILSAAAPQQAAAAYVSALQKIKQA